MILIQVWTARLIQYASIEQCFGKSLKVKRKQNFSSKNQFILSKLKSNEFAEELTVHKVCKLMHAWFTLKGEV